MYAVMIGLNNFPNGDAGAVRDLAFARIYQELGYDVVMICQSRESDKGNYQKICFYSIYSQRNSILEHASFYFGIKKKVKDILYDVIQEKGEAPSLLHITELPYNCINSLIRFSRKNHVDVIYNCTEWYSACEFSKGKFDKSYIANDLINRKMIRRPMKVIAISQYLYDHFKGKGLDVIRIPVIMDKCDCKNRNFGDKVNVVYAGNIGGKDDIKQLIQAVAMLRDDERSSLIINIYGIKEEDLRKACGVSVLPECVKAYGRVPRSEVERALDEADFSYLLRSTNERYAKAGFPTKVVEAMMHRTAVLCNFSSDLKRYLTDKKNAVIIKENSAEAIKDALLEILKMDRNTIEEIKTKAQETAEKEFYYENYVKQMKTFIEK